MFVPFSRNSLNPSLPRRRPLGFVTQSFLPHRSLLIRALNSFPIVRKYQLESTCQNQKQSYLSLHLTKFHHTCTKIIRKLFSIQGVNYFLRAVKTNSRVFLTNAMPTAFADDTMFFYIKYYRQPPTTEE